MFLGADRRMLHWIANPQCLLVEDSTKHDLVACIEREVERTLEFYLEMCHVSSWVSNNIEG